MQCIGNKDSEKISVYTTSNPTITCPSWWGSFVTHVPPSSFSSTLNLNMNTPMEVSHQGKQQGRNLLDSDSSCTRTAGQPYQEVEGAISGKTYEQFISIQSGCDGINKKRIDGHMKPVLSLGTTNMSYSESKADYVQPVVQFSYPYVAPYLSGVVPSYENHAIIYPEVMGTITNGRVPLPLELSEDRPIYVNAKQYRGILRRRQLRAKLEAQNKLVKGRKPYLHESRHLHAMKRIRGSGGRFLNTKGLQKTQQGHHQQSKCSILNMDGKSFSGSPTGASGSDITSISSNTDIFQLQDHLSIADFHSNMSGGMHRRRQNGINLMHIGPSGSPPIIK